MRASRMTSRPVRVAMRRRTAHTADDVTSRRLACHRERDDEDQAMSWYRDDRLPLAVLVRIAPSVGGR
jgi:hypothetical protein